MEATCGDHDLYAACGNQVDSNGDTVPDCLSSITYTDANGDPITTANVCTVTTTCKTFTDQWIFNIADFVNVLFGIDPDGSYNVQIRFYPLPLINSQTP